MTPAFARERPAISLLKPSFLWCCFATLSEILLTRFMSEVAEEDQDIALGIMRRLYTMADPEPDTLQKYPALEVLEDDDREPGSGTSVRS